MKKMILLLIISLVTSSCITPNRHKGILVPEELGSNQYGKLSDSKKIEFLTDYRNYSLQIAQRIVNNIVWIGMSKEQLIYSWGYPDDINETITAYSNHEQWVYERGDYEYQFIYLEDGIVTTIQD